MRSWKSWVARRLLAALAAALSFAPAAAFADGNAEAQPYARPPRDPYDGYARVAVVVDPYGLYVGAGLIGMRVLDQSRGAALIESGSGLTIYGGLRLSRSLALELGWAATFHEPARADNGFGSGDSLALNGFTADAKIYLGGEGDRVEPYVQGGVGLYLLDSTYLGARSVGSGFQGGGGFDFHIGSYVDLGGRALYRGIAMGPPHSDENDTFISAIAGEANLTLRF